MMNQLIQLLSENARLTSKQLADMTGDTPQGVEAKSPASRPMG